MIITPSLNNVESFISKSTILGKRPVSENFADTAFPSEFCKKFHPQNISNEIQSPIAPSSSSHKRANITIIDNDIDSLPLPIKRHCIKTLSIKNINNNSSPTTTYSKSHSLKLSMKRLRITSTNDSTFSENNSMQYPQNDVEGNTDILQQVQTLLQESKVPLDKQSYSANEVQNLFNHFITESATKLAQQFDIKANEIYNKIHEQYYINKNQVPSYIN